MSQVDTAGTTNRGASNIVVWFARHWLAIFNIAWGVYVLLPFAAPLLMAAGLTAPARLIYGVYSIFCHQLPDHSYFLNSLTYEIAPTAATLAAGGMPTDLSLFQERRFIGNNALGYKVAICQRDVAIYGSIFLAGLLYAFLRERSVRISWKAAVLLTVPMAIDGLTQMFGLRESTWLVRSVTGALFGFGMVWFLYPVIQTSMDDVIRTEKSRWLEPPQQTR